METLYTITATTADAASHRTNGNSSYGWEGDAGPVTKAEAETMVRYLDPVTFEWLDDAELTIEVTLNGEEGEEREYFILTPVGR